MTQDHNQLTQGLQTMLRTFQTINVVNICIILYLSASTVIYGIWKLKIHKERPAHELNGKMIYVGCVLTIIADLPRFIMTQVVFNVKTMKAGLEHCEELVDATNLLYVLGTSPNYFFLWYRQHTINTYPAVQGCGGKYSKSCSYFVLVAYIVLSPVLTYFYISPESSIGESTGCVLKPLGNNTSSAEELSRGIRDSVLGIGLIIAEILLLALFLYPLHRSKLKGNSHTKGLRNNNNRNESVAAEGDVSYDYTDRETTSRKSNFAMHDLIKRSTIATAIVVAADLAVMIAVNVGVPRLLPIPVLLVIHNIPLIIHAVCILFTFSYYKKILKAPYDFAVRRRRPN